MSLLEIIVFVRSHLIQNAIRPVLI